MAYCDRDAVIHLVAALLGHHRSKTVVQASTTQVTSYEPVQTFGDGTTEKVIIMRSGYSSRILEINRVPMPEPVPPPKEWQT
jgi:hypothetical protein